MMKHLSQTDTTLLEILVLLSPASSKTTLRSWLKEGRVQIEKEVVTSGAVRVREGQEVTVGARKKIIGEGIRILYEDSHLVVIDKPYSLLSVSTAFEKEDTAHSFLKDYYRPRKVFVVHRLDQDTSGVMLFALSESAHSKLKALFEKHDLERNYTAIVEGRLEKSSGTWKSRLYEDDNYYVHSTTNPELGQVAITHYQVKETSARYSWLNVTLETGKKNQIRVHCQEAGHPVVGDKKYGAVTNPLRRLGLHANRLAFFHPVTHKEMKFESDVPPEFSKLMG